MKVLSLQSHGVHSGCTLFAVGFEADNGQQYAEWVDGRTLNTPGAFAAFAAEKAAGPCTSEFTGDEGGWHAHLGNLLRCSSGVVPATSNTATFAATAAEGRKDALLASTSLGQAALAAQRAPVAEAPKAEVVVETFADKCRRESEEAELARRATRAEFLKLTPLGRDVLKADKS
jgi:hypothetical protein